MNKKIGVAIMALVVTMSVGFTSVYADPASDKIKVQQIQTKKNDLVIKVEITDNQIEAIISKMKINENNIAKIQKDIKQDQMNILDIEGNIKAEQILFNKRMRAMYMGGSSSFIEVILASKGINDFISRVENVKMISKFDQNVIGDLKTNEAKINLKKVALDTKSTKLLSLRVDNKKKLATLTKQKTDQIILVAQLNAEENQYGAQMVTDQAGIAKEVALEKKTNEAIFSSNPVLAYASDFLGIPYVWGGTSPKGFDCSGFTQYVFGHFGVNLPRVSEDQQNVGTLVSRADLRPGDLVFFGTPAHHVGIYIGNGNMINAPHTGAVIRVQTLNSDFTYGRRVTP
ncbi:C40 family peptidase [Clostridium estertheticum]|uniref:C40 family peptidase n=1 Tax=Clostridium estertheticum TaxID=238834 RepID=UPI001C0D6BE5|nr:NlpC/P60 family protein [Clostridium estertheticum]MBU3184918.1 C40 family peptidase [Clostridium estertheticum]